MTTITQPTKLPTNKLTACMIAAAGMAVIEPVWAHYVPMLDDQRIYDLIQWGVAFLAAYCIKDSPNVRA